MVTKKPSTVPPGLPAVPCNPDQAAPPTQNLVGTDGRDLRYIFVSPPKFVVGTTVPDPVYFHLLDYPGGISGFYEDAIAKFDGDTEALLRAAALFSDERKRSRQTTAIRSANGRVSRGAHDKILAMEAALRGIRGISKAKVLAGLIQLYLNV
jgi:hypothetical protein